MHIKHVSKRIFHLTLPLHIHIYIHIYRYRIKTPEEYASDTNTEVPVLKKYLRYSHLDEIIMKCPLANKSKMSAGKRVIY